MVVPQTIRGLWPGERVEKMKRVGISMILTIAMAALIGCAKTPKKAEAGEKAPAAAAKKVDTKAAPATEEKAAKDEAAPAEGAETAAKTGEAEATACVCEKGQAGEAVWCEKCGKGCPGNGGTVPGEEVPEFVRCPGHTFRRGIF